MEITEGLRDAATNAWGRYSAAADVPWRPGEVSKIAFRDGYLTALEYPPEGVLEAIEREAVSSIMAWLQSIWSEIGEHTPESLEAEYLAELSGAKA